MTLADTRASPVPETTVARLPWGPIIAGAIAAAALGLVLHSFALAIGLSVSSTAPTWRDASFALVLLSGLYLLLAAIVSYGFGAYVATRLRATAAGTPDATEFRDGMSGLVVWALATLITVLIAFAAAPATSRLAAPQSRDAGTSSSVGSENLLAYDLDRLFRGSERRPDGNLGYARAEAARILLTASSHRGLVPDDRAYLVQLVSARTGVTGPDAEKRVDDVVARAKENITRARRAAVVLAFMVGAAALAGAVTAWFAGCLGGEHRDGRVEPHFLLDWGRTRRA